MFTSLILFRAELFEEAINRCNVIIILDVLSVPAVSSNQQRALETHFMFVLDHHLHKAANLFAFPRRSVFSNAFITFAPAP